MTSIPLASPSEDLVVTAEDLGWTLRPRPSTGLSLSERAGWPTAVSASPRGRRIISEAEQLIDMEIAVPDGTGLIIPWNNFGAIFSQAFGLPLLGSSPSPLMLRIDSHSQVSRKDFQYKYEFLLGARPTAVERAGYFVRRQVTGAVYCLDERTHGIVAAMDAFNALPAEERGRPSSWLTFATVKNGAAEIGATLDAALASNDVVIPSQLALGMCAHDDGSLSFYPICDGLPEDDLKQAFFRNVDAENLYTLGTGDGRRVRVVLDDRQRTVLERMKQVRRMRGEQRTEALRNPAQYFDGVLDAITIYGERVIGVGDFPGSVMPPNPNPGGGFFVQEAPKPPSTPDGDSPQPPATETHDYRESVELPIGDSEELNRFQKGIEQAIRYGHDSLEWNGATILITPGLLRALELAVTSEVAGRGTASRGRKYLLVYTNEDELRAKDVSDAAFTGTQVSHPSPPSLPKALADGFELKSHQSDAVAWLHRCSDLRPQRRGVLLADEMGLGKTVEVLTFLAKHIEDGGLACDEVGADGLPLNRPILIVVPLMLLENETWQGEMRRFFKHGGNVFLPLLPLHGAGIDRVRTETGRGAEPIIGRPVLNAMALMKHRVVVTNYETVVNYQHSLAQLYNGKRPIWSVVVTDEAQKQKAPDTKVSAALKAISADFKIAMTGTPVENRLLDLWNIVDYFQPALLGTKREFCSTYEEPATGPGAPDALEALRSRLLYRTPQTYLLRRTTAAIVGDLPAKSIQPLRCDMSDEERDAHLSLLSILGGERKRGRHLQVLQRLVRLYQHPALDHEHSTRDDPQTLLAQAAKLRAVVELLRQIKTKGEKVIIFARFVDAQQILSLVVSDAFGIAVPIINGSTSRTDKSHGSSAGTERARNSRKAMLDAFRARPGFGVLILSPFVAGIGLTIVEANHVIHYGRWWNPAVEAQATARVFRIGQERPVHVYLPILVDPKHVIAKTFDELLHELMQRKESLAHDFLVPVPQEDECAAELCDGLLSGGESGVGVESPFTAEQLASLEPSDFEAAVGALLAAEGFRVVLTARSNDGGADVVALRDGRALLIQAKHSTSSLALDESALNDLIGAADIYGPRLAVKSYGLLLASNVSPTPAVKASAASYGIELLCGDALVQRIKRANIGLGAMVGCATTRCRSFEEGIRRLHANGE